MTTPTTRPRPLIGPGRDRLRADVLRVLHAGMNALAHIHDCIKADDKASAARRAPTSSRCWRRTVSNFTPGPWGYFLDSEGYYAISHESEAHEPGDVAHVYIPGAVDPEYDDGNEGLANARLVAAAPMMLAALETVTSEMDHAEDCLSWDVDEEAPPASPERLAACDCTYSVVCAAIAKARDGAP